MDGWNTSFLLGWPIFRGRVSFKEGTSRMHGQIGFIEVSRLHVFMISCAKNKFSQNHGLDQKDFSTLHGTCMSLCAPPKTNITIQKNDHE